MESTKTCNCSSGVTARCFQRLLYGSTLGLIFSALTPWDWFVSIHGFARGDPGDRESEAGVWDNSCLGNVYSSSILFMDHDSFNNRPVRFASRAEFHVLSLIPLVSGSHLVDQPTCEEALGLTHSENLPKSN
jgi:hypothetical protein